MYTVHQIQLERKWHVTSAVHSFIASFIGAVSTTLKTLWLQNRIILFTLKRDTCDNKARRVNCVVIFKEYVICMDKQFLNIAV